MTDRTSLALAACKGLTDQELAERGVEGYRKMRDRKRHYAAMARGMAAVILQAKEELEKKDKHIAALTNRIAQMQMTINEMQSLDAPVGDTTQAASLLANLGKKGAE